jgi:two-component system, response regulator FlrC
MRLLIIGELNGHITAAAKIAISKGAHVNQVNTTLMALDLLRNGESADLIMIDVGQDIKSFIEACEIELLNAPIVACGIAADAKAAVRAIRAGAQEYVPLPPDAEMIGAMLHAVCQESSEIIHADPETAKVLALAERVAPTEASILITGESGTGKEVLARFIHQKSKRSSQKMVSINCAAIPENLLESELFGYEKGAFTGAVSRRIGKFEEASGGTLFLDEISEMHPRLQAKLLRAVQEKEIDRLGGSNSIKVDIRLMASSNRDLQDEVKKGQFREDLYFRLNVMNIKLQPLRNRPKDIPVLAEYFLKKYRNESTQPINAISSEALESLMTYNWPGNVRELENVIHRAMLLNTGSFITKESLHLTDFESPSKKEDTVSLQQNLVGQSMSEVERSHILNTLTHCVGNRTHAAHILGISIRTLRNKLKQYNEENLFTDDQKEGEKVA